MDGAPIHCGSFEDLKEQKRIAQRILGQQRVQPCGLTSASCSPSSLRFLVNQRGQLLTVRCQGSSDDQEGSMRCPFLMFFRERSFLLLFR
jgi:hypothetical protein